MSKKTSETVIIGAGLAGLSTAYFLKKPYKIFEKNESPGGLCSSYTQDGFTFDYTGHLLHFKHEWTQKLASELLSGNIRKIERNASIYSHEKFTPYPFQSNTFGLPPTVIREVLIGFINSLICEERPEKKKDNYEKWIERTFGKGIAKHFMLPYNKKLWKYDLKNLSTDWVDEYIPKPDFEMVLDGALGIKTHTLGYNSYFYYPKSGGIEKLIDGFTNKIENINTGISITSVDTKNKLLTTSEGKEIEFEHLISTIPLNKLLEITKPNKDSIIKAIQKLDYISVFNINLGISREKISPYHWIYFPEEEFNFYRCGFPTNFSDTLAPPDTSSIYIEISYPKNEVIDFDKEYDKAIDGLIKANILNSKSEIIHKSFRNIEVAYILHNHERSQLLAHIFDYLEKRNISSIGRYGAWEYSAMEEAILWGKNISDKLSE